MGSSGADNLSTALVSSKPKAIVKKVVNWNERDTHNV